MNSLEELRTVRASSILFECIAGSRAYGTSTAASDEDVRGTFAVPAASYIDLVRPPDQLSDERGNVVYYSLRRVVELLVQANPNILELLFMPADCVLKSSPEMEALVSQRHLFISKQCADAHAGYAMSQIRKAKGQNKWVNNPRPASPPVKEDYCYIVPWHAENGSDGPPARPIALKEIGWSLNEYHAARLEHGHDTYRLYYYGKGARGVFRGGTLACESIPKEDEKTHFAGFLLYSEQAWKQALLEHQNYWAWRRDRNDARWQQQERGELDFDAKNRAAQSVKGRVLAELQRIEREHGVRVLLAVESGSRAWGVASPDSDYDVRFIYAHTRDWYISVLEPRDVIEEMLPGDLDVSGWDLRKTLRLFSRCNLALNEWLGLPIVYSEDGEFRQQLVQLMPQFFNPIAGIHHYRSMATRTFNENYADGRIGIKKLFYVLRPLLACRWIESRRSQPPTNFAELVATEFVTPDERHWIRDLLVRKADARESAAISLDPSRAASIEAELERYKSAAGQMLSPSNGSTSDLDSLLRTWAVK